MTLAQLTALFASRGVTRLYAKVLSPNDNNKNQPYFGGSWEALNLLPAGAIEEEPGGKRPNFKAALNFFWLQDDGTEDRAPGAQLILYPDYPEVRFSGYLNRCRRAPRDIMGPTRAPGRVLFLGVRGLEVVGYAAIVPHAAAAELIARADSLPAVGVFRELKVRADTRRVLLDALARVHSKGWILAWRLGADGVSRPCTSPNCGGHTLEAELGIVPNGKAEPDFAGWEVKQHSVSDLRRPASGGALTLFTPEPDGGFYADEGAAAFVRKYGYPDKKGRADRRNFGGTHKVDETHEQTGMTLVINGYDKPANQITHVTGGLELFAGTKLAARWSFRKLIEHWNMKHARAVYVPSMCRVGADREYLYGDLVRLGEGTEFRNVLRALSVGRAYYDPGIKVEGVSSGGKMKVRNQFRIRSKDVGALYTKFETVKVI